MGWASVPVMNRAADRLELVADPVRRTGRTLLSAGVEQSYVDVADPRHLHFEYVRRIASAVEVAAPAGAPLSVLHLGGGALTLPRWLAATRPGSPQRVVERDAAVVELVGPGVAAAAAGGAGGGRRRPGRARPTPRPAATTW